MKTAQAVAMVKGAGHDLSDEYSTEECLEFLNTAIGEVAGILIAGGSSALLHETQLHDGEALPARYVRSAGLYPLRVTGNTVELLNPAVEEIRFRYFATPELLADDAGELPFSHDLLNDYVVKIASLYALNRNEYDIQQDKMLYDELRQVILGAVS